MKKLTAKLFCCLTALCLLLSGCGGAKAPAYEQLSPYITSVDGAALPATGIIALGEATHGNSEFTRLKQQVFELLTQQGVRAFALEGDFGGCQKVNDYICGGDGTAEQAAGEIGFAIYKTREMADLLAWMRDFNEGREPADQIRFYGFDMQRYDNNKELLFEILEQTTPDLGRQYEEALAGFTDETMYDLEEAAVEEALTRLEALNAELDAQRETITAASSAEDFALARQYAQCLFENTQLRIAKSYGTLRDGFMAGQAAWIQAFDAQYYGGQALFLTGHNSHIGKTTATAGTEKCMGQLLAEQYGEGYYAIGAEFYESTFLAPDAGSGERRTFTIQNSGDDRLAVLLNGSGMESLFLDIDAAAQNADLADYLTAKQPMSAVGESFSDSMARLEAGYTQKLSPAETYDGLIFFSAMTPSTMLETA